MWLVVTLEGASSVVSCHKYVTSVAPVGKVVALAVGLGVGQSDPGYVVNRRFLSIKRGGRAEQVVEVDGAGITAFRGITSNRPAPQLNFFVRPQTVLRRCCP